MPSNAPNPTVPNYAWDWLQRSRAVVTEASLRLAGMAPPAGFVDDLRWQYSTDPFVRAVLADVVVDVAFGGRVPERQPAGANWDRGMRWWAATLRGVTPADFDAPAQPTLFPVESVPTARRARVRRADGERAALAAALRAMLERADAGQVPAAAVRQLLAQLESG